MASDPTKILLGTTLGSDKVVTSIKGTAVIDAGLAVRLKSTGVPSVAKSDGSFLGVSLGVDMSDLTYTAVCRVGYGVPIQLTDDSAEYAYVVIGAAVWIDDVTGLANIVDDGSVTTTVTNAVYVSAPMKGVKSDGTEIYVALIDMQGGL
jgi:hypothetical protein